MKRTQDEIVARIEARIANDLFGFEVSEYLDFLDYEHAKPYLKEDATAEQWTETYPLTDPRAVMTDYMAFAWEKANGYRGISASRSMSHYVAWLWLDNAPDELINSLEGYQYYGKPQLRAICQYLGLDADKWDDGIRRNSEP